LIERDDFRRADSIAQSVLNEFPDNTIFLRIKALIKLWTGRYNEALKSGRRLVTLTERRRPFNWSDLVAGYMVLVQSYDKLGRKQEACSTAQSLLGLKIPAEYLQIPHIKKNVKYISGIRQKCRKERW
jgi:predicted Zn-dependent protease